MKVRRSTALVAVKMAVLPPKARARVKMAAMITPGHSPFTARMQRAPVTFPWMVIAEGS